MIDYRLPENRPEYFRALYRMNLEHKIMPGLVYLYLPELRKLYGWDDETTLWVAFINGLTQSPLTTLRILERLPSCPPAGAALASFTEWFNDEWVNLHFDSDRLKNKRNTVKAIQSYASVVAEYGTQAAMLATTRTYAELWETAQRFYSMGRLSCFSYLEYVHLLGFGADCDDLMFDDKSGSRSHRNGMMFLLGHDHMVWDKRSDSGFDGNYSNLNKIAKYLSGEANDFLCEFNETTHHAYANNFTLESQCCQFKNGFFGRRFPGVYSWMAWDRIKWYDDRGLSQYTEIFKTIREENLPDWLRPEVTGEKRSISQLSKIFVETGVPFNAEYFL
jgi:hypothetical protein